MDLVTQGLIGATLAQAGAKPNEVRLATLIGFCAPLLADADTLIRSAEDPLLFLEYHRHFSHALLFIPIGAMIASLLLWPLLRSRLSFKSIYFYAFLGYGTAGLLDACTSYGTHLLWPFSDQRIAWSIISIFDPLFSLVLIAAIAIGAITLKPLVAQVGVVLAAAYLSLGAVQHDRAQSVAEENARQRGHSIERLIVKPTMANLLLWRSVYETEGMYYVDAVRVGLLGNNSIFTGNKVQAFEHQRDLPELPGQTLVSQDIERFAFFSDGFVARHPQRPDVLGDVRYAMLPTSIRPLWGIQLPLDAPDQHVRFETDRTMSVTERKAFLEMLFD